MTALHIATHEGLTKVVEVLLEGGAKVDFKNKSGKTPLHIAAENEYLEIVKLLLKYDADIDSREYLGRTALHLACMKTNILIVKTLLKHGCDINIKCKVNLSAFHYVYNNIAINYDDTNEEDFCNTASKTTDCIIITNILEDHIVKMKTANLRLTRGNLLALFALLEDEKTMNFQSKCEKEVSLMQSEMISNTNVSFYDILTKDVSRLTTYARNKNITQVLTTVDYKIKFPIYGNMIKCNFGKGIRRNGLLQEANQLFDSRLLYDCSENIFSYLSDGDLRNVVKACKPTDVCMAIT